MNDIKKIYDSFKVKRAPKVHLLNAENEEIVRYAPEAYTAEYMTKSDSTKRLLRYVVELQDGRKVSLYEAFGVSSAAKSIKKANLEVIRKMKDQSDVYEQFIAAFDFSAYSSFKDFQFALDNDKDFDQLYRLCGQRLTNEADQYFRMKDIIDMPQATLFDYAKDLYQKAKAGINFGDTQVKIQRMLAAISKRDDDLKQDVREIAAAVMA